MCADDLILSPTCGVERYEVIELMSARRPMAGPDGLEHRSEAAGSVRKLVIGERWSSGNEGLTILYVEVTPL